ncbi:MAG: hypothetical protein IJM80_04225 [Firmicutes bacterium]|nr:hypothetical protein [Bacillota bacterium]
MIKRIRDFIYDINDVFVAIVILLIAVGVIFWRSTSIMAYPQYLAEKNGNTNTANIDFSDIDLTPEDVQDINPNPDDPKIDEQTQPGSETNPGGETPQGGDTQPGGETPQGGNDQPGGQTDPQQQGSQDGSVTAEIVVPSFKNGGTWGKTADKLIEAGLMKSDEKAAFIAKVSELNCDTKLQPGTYTLTNTSYEDMINILCRIKR